MTHPHRAEVSSHVKERLNRFKSMGGSNEESGEKDVAAKAVHQHERALHPNEKETKLALASGGRATKRLDRKKRFPGGTAGGMGNYPIMSAKKGGRAEHKRGGHAKGKNKTQVNVIVAGHGAPPAQPPIPPALAARPPVPPPSPPGMAGPPPPGAVPPQALAAMMAGAPHARGGRTGHAKGGKVMTAGAGSGVGREEKAERAKVSP